MKKNVLEIKGLTKYYHHFLALDHLDLTLLEGEIFGFIGPNGAGKSTTIRTIMHLIKADAGKIFFNGKELLQDDLSAKKLIGYLPSEIHLYEDMTVKDILNYHESFYQNDLKPYRQKLTDTLKLDERRKIEELSLGNLKKLGIVLAMMHKPQLLILDEPTSGLDPLIQQCFFELLKEAKANGTTIFYSTHVLSEISRLCDRVGIIKEGKLLQVESIEEIRHKNLNVVTIVSRDVQQIINDFHLDLTCRDNTIHFKNEMDANELIAKLTKYDIEEIYIEEAPIEDIFLHYYTKEKPHA